MTHSKLTIIIIYTAVALFIGTTAFLPPAVYGSWWWFLFWALTGAALAASMIKGRLWRRPALFGLHLSFLLMIAGGGATFLFATRGTIRLQPGKRETTFCDKNMQRHPLPCALTLDRFEKELYPGMSFPRDFHSYVKTGDGSILHISMNNIGRRAGWRFYQTSYDSTGASVITVVHDPAGIALSYAGYLLFAISGALAMALPYRRLRRSRRRHARSAATFAILIVVALSPAKSQGARGVPQSFADSLERRQVLFNGRAVTFGAMASEFTAKITGASHAGTLTPARFVASLMIYPEDWRNEEIIRIKSDALRKALGTTENHVSVMELYDATGRYIPESLYGGGRSILDKEIMRLDERVALLARLWSGTLFEPLPHNSGLRHSETYVSAELLYHRLRPVRFFFIIAIGAGALSLIFLAAGKRFPVRASGLTAFLLGIAIFAWRLYLSDHIPLACAGDILYFAGVMLAGVSALVARRSATAAAAGLLLAGCIGLAAWLSLREPAMTPLMPVLRSPWLVIHVALVMSAYALLAFTLPVAVTGLCSRRNDARLLPLIHSLLMSGVYLLGLGIFTGAMWANVSWGRYWAWDPKETWALVTMMLYALPLHRRLGFESNARFTYYYVSCCFLSILMTYAGVNYLPSMHAYQ